MDITQASAEHQVCKAQFDTAMAKLSEQESLITNQGGNTMKKQKKMRCVLRCIRIPHEIDHKINQICQDREMNYS
ncbi:hypothetical protein ACSLOP_30110, partial [Escherichia coli]